jgi:hypothetical protein
MTFFFEEKEQRDVVFVKASRRARTRGDSVIMENLGSGLRDQTMEPLLVTLQPGAGSGDEPIVHCCASSSISARALVTPRMARRRARLKVPSLM